jgi:hypothetical protein
MAGFAVSTFDYHQSSMNHLKILGERQPPGVQSREDAVFTRFLQDLEPDRPMAGEGFEEVWQALRRLLVAELKRRNLWTLSPAYLGIYGSPSWADDEAVEELVADGFVFIFAERLRCLKAYLRFKPDVEGMVVRSARNFLHEAQKRHDPVGFRVFTVLRGAVRAAVEAGALHVVAGSHAVRRGTVLAFAGGGSPGEAADAADADQLASAVRAWNDALLPDLITARGWEVRPLMARVEEHLLRLPLLGFPVYRFEELVDPLRRDARARWRALWAGAQGEVLPQAGEELAVLPVMPARNLEERESFRNLLECLERGIEALAQRTQSKEYLRRLQIFLRNHAAEAIEAQAGGGLPSYRRIADLLGIPRERLPGLFATLQQLAAACRRSSGRTLR